MSDWFRTLAAGDELPVDAASQLDERGFVVWPGVVPAGSMERLTTAYTEAMTSASGDDIRVGSTSTKVSDLVNRGPAFDALYVCPPLLAACRQVIGRPFKLSSFHARTLRPGAHAQELHVDVRRRSADWPLLGFILMVDDFRPDNGATRFVPGSHRWSDTPEDTMPDVRAAHDAEVLACGAAGSLLVFDGSAWHGHTANTSNGPRRSIQGAFIPGEGRAATDFAARMQPETRARLSLLAHTVLALPAT
jgi:ectoine hydroxylase-related dioxygenase (phytanoyl-CoA dioxygenase family)